MSNRVIQVEDNEAVSLTDAYYTPFSQNGTSDGGYIESLSLSQISNLNSGGESHYNDYTNTDSTVLTQRTNTISIHTLLIITLQLMF